MVRSTKINNSASSTFEIRITDKAGNSTVCDPVMTMVVQDGSGLIKQSFTGLPAAEHEVLIANEDPGLKMIEFVVNGKKFKEHALSPGEQRTFSVASAMRPGSDNTIEIIGKGRKGGAAFVVISD